MADDRERAAPIDLRAAPAPRAVDADGRLPIDGVDLDALADAFGTPLYVYDEDELRARVPRVPRRVRRRRRRRTRARRSCASPMARLVAEEGLAPRRRDRRRAPRRAARRASRRSASCSTATTSRTPSSRLALDAGVGRIVADSFDELDRIEALVAGGARRAVACSCGSRPGVEAHTHEYIETGADDSKFGFTVVERRRARRRAARSRSRDAMRVRRLPLPHRLADPRARVVRPRRGAIVAGLAAEVAGATGVADRRDQPRRRARRAATLADDLDAPAIARVRVVGPRRRSPTRARRSGLAPAPRLTVEAGPFDRGAGRRHAVHASARSRRSPACAPTSRSTAG